MSGELCGAGLGPGCVLPTSDFLQRERALCALVCKRACKPPPSREYMPRSFMWAGGASSSCLCLCTPCAAHQPTTAQASTAFANHSSSDMELRFGKQFKSFNFLRRDILLLDFGERFIEISLHLKTTFTFYSSNFHQYPIKFPCSEETRRIVSS